MKSNKIIGFAGYSGVGKTTILTQVIKILSAKGYKISVIKHAHHNFDIDKPGKDSYELRKSGAKEVLVSSKTRWVVIHENYEEKECNLNELIEKINPDNVDVIIVEGFKNEKFPKIEIYRKGISKTKLHERDNNIIAVATDKPSILNTKINILNLNNPDQISEFIIDLITN
tara:strand:- start:1196 stop:1708 length:513 start_codon:yes stop_codon:yes gene_type:complete